MWAPLVLALAAAAAAADCPRYCECKWRSGKESALCAGAGLSAVPPRLPPTTQLLDFSENRLAAIRDDAFAAAGLVNLQRLYLAGCGVRALRPHALRDLVNLVELDLSRNRLEAVPSHAFAAIPELRELRLDANPIAKVKDEAFHALPHLVRLSMKGCKIAEIEPRSFVGVEATLEYLEIDKNRLQILHVAALAPLRALKGLEVANNPWECTCALRPMRDWMIRRNVPATVVPECALPPRLRAQPWDRLELEDFACPPEVSALAKHTVGVEGGDVTLTCRVIGVPAPRLRWLRAGRLLANSTHLVNTGRSFVLRSEGQSSNLSIKTADMQDAGSYTCAAENKAGKAEAVLTLAVQRRPPDRGLGGRALLASLAVAGLVALTLCLVGLCVYETRKKKQLDRWNEQIVSANRRESYEKIEMNHSKSDDSRKIVIQCDGRKRGDYRNVPSHDPEEGEGGARVVREARCVLPLGREESWRRARLSPPPASWAHRQEPDLHIPRLGDFDTRAETTPDSVQSSTSTRILGAPIKNITDEVNRINNNAPPRTAMRSTPRDRLDNDQSGSDSEKNYPDLIEMSSLGASYLRGDKKRDPYFTYTIPRRKDADSRSPLLGSRRNSSGGDSFCSFERSFEPRPKPAGRRSNSFVDLAGNNGRLRRNPSLPASPTRPTVPSATPLLDLTGLRDYSQMDAPLEDYDFRASQLEKFLEEYRNLREQLSKMKETRENLQKHRAADGAERMKGRTSVAVTEASSLAALDPPLALGEREWLSTLMYRN